MKLVCGLGNPGREYAFSRHNIGYLLIDNLCERFRIRLGGGKGDFLYGKATFAHDNGKEDIVLSKPSLSMNLSGISVLQLVERLNPGMENLLLVLDDVNLPFGKIRLRRQGSHGGHRGLESVIYQLGTDRFPRLRIGIGDAIDSYVLKEYVLEEFSEFERSRLPDVVEQAGGAVLTYLSEPIETAMSKVNGPDPDLS